MAMRQMKILILVTAMLAGTEQPSNAACGFLGDALDYAMSNYRSYKSENEKMQARLLAAEAECKVTGASISEKANKLASALSCTAQKEVSDLNEEISGLGQKCETVFVELKSLQTELYSRFSILQSDLNEGMKIISTDTHLKKYCGAEIEVTTTMVAAYLLLEGNIASVREQSRQGEEDYQKLKSTGQALAGQTKSLAQNCGNTEETANVALSEEGKKASGLGSGVVSGKSPLPTSDISGSVEAIDDAALSKEIINSQK